MPVQSKTTVVLEKALIDAFRELYPQRGAMKSFFNKCLRKFVEIHDHDEEAVVRMAVEEAVKEMEEEEEE